MSGHSKWATTKNKKAAIDAKRAGLFTKASKNITLAARGGGDPDTNFSLRLAIDKAKEVNMPKENIEKAINKGAGVAGGAALEELVLEAFGPSGVPLIIETVTDNKNRTMPEVKSIITKHGGTLGNANSVRWMFERKGVINILAEAVTDKDQLLMDLIEWGAEDVLDEAEGLVVYSKFEDFEKVKRALEEKNVKLEYAALEWVAKESGAADDELKAKVDSIKEALEEHDDVNAVYSNI